MVDVARLIDPQLLKALENTPVHDLEKLKETRRLDAAFGSTLAAISISADPELGSVTVEDHVIPASDGYLIAARLYRPALAPVPLPALLMCHGGAFCLGDLDTEDFRCRRYARDAGCAVLNVAYRLAPEHRYPVPFDDCYASLLWMAENAGALGLDRDCLGVAGESAGGALAAATTLAARDRSGPNLVAQLLLFPALDHRMRTASMQDGTDFPAWTTTQTRKMWSYYIGEGQASVPVYASPATADDVRDLPATFIACAEFDPLRDEAICYANRLRQSGIRTELHCYLGTYHVFDAVWPTTELSQLALLQQTAFLKRHLRRS